MRSLVVVVMLVLAQAGLAQEPGTLTGIERSADGGYVVTGVDPLGADVTVVYNEALMKTYQERTLDGETVFARYNDGKLEDYGVYAKPMAQSSEPKVLLTSKDD